MLSHQARAPMRGSTRLLLQSLRDHRFDYIVAVLARRAEALLVIETGNAILGIPLAPFASSTINARTWRSAAIFRCR